MIITMLSISLCEINELTSLFWVEYMFIKGTAGIARDGKVGQVLDIDL